MVTRDDQLETFAEQLRAAHGANLVALVLYGAATTNEATAGATGYHTLAVLARVAPEDLRAARGVVGEWLAAGHAPPVYFSEEEIANAADVFPVEFLDMMDNRRILAGRDPFESLTVSTHHLRHQVEFELRGKLVRLRELYIPVCDDAERITALMVESLGTFAKLFRFALRLAGVAAPTGRRETLDTAIGHFALDRRPFDLILTALDTGRPLPEAEAHECFGAYLEQIQRVIGAVDVLPDA